MSRMTTAKKKALTLQKEKLEEELKLYEKQIEEAKRNQTKTNLYYDESSDSDSDVSIHLDTGPSIFNLKMQHSTLETCFNATTELTGLQILESEVNVLVDDPVLENESPVTEAGIWKEVTVECKVDLITFTMSFYVHESSRLFGPLSYRSLQVAASKPAHEKELSKSVLVDVKKPSDAFEVIKSYAAANRSRRTTLAQLVETYGGSLFMMPMADGGYKLKCANLLEISWFLQNKSSSIAPFKHQMTFDLEYKDESLLKTITQANKQLCNPSIVTEDRTLLLSTIISACLEAQGGLHSGTDTESETAGSQKRSIVNEAEAPDAPEAKKRKDAEAMAPPKVPPKKFKPKGKDTNADSHTKKSDVNKKTVGNENIKNVKQKLDGNTARVINKEKTAVKNNDKQTAVKPSNKNDRGKKITTDVGNIKRINDDRNKSDGKSVANPKNVGTNKTSNERNKDKENIFASKDKINKVDTIKNKNNKPIQNNEKLKSNNDVNSNNNKKNAKLLNVRDLTDSRLVKHGNNKADNVNLQKTKIPQAVNVQSMKKNLKNPLRISPRKAVDNSTTSQNSTQSASSITNKPKGNIPRLLKKPYPKTK